MILTVLPNWVLAILTKSSNQRHSLILCHHEICPSDPWTVINYSQKIPLGTMGFCAIGPPGIRMNKLKNWSCNSATNRKRHPMLLGLGTDFTMKLFIPLCVKSRANTFFILLQDICPNLWCQIWNWSWLVTWLHAVTCLLHESTAKWSDASVCLSNSILLIAFLSKMYKPLWSLPIANGLFYEGAYNRHKDSVNCTVLCSCSHSLLLDNRLNMKCGTTRALFRTRSFSTLSLPCVLPSLVCH